MVPDGSRPRGAPRRAKTFHGKPCKVCGCTERYMHGCGCVNCERLRAINRNQERSRATVIADYGIPPEFTRWATTRITT